MPDTIQSIKVNGTSYKIDYETLENRPCYHEEALGEVLLDNVTITGEEAWEITASPLEADVTAGEWLRFTFDGTAMDLCCDVIDDGTTITYVASGDAVLRWTKTGGTYGNLTIQHPDIAGGNTYVVSLRRLEKESKVLDGELGTPVFPAARDVGMVAWAPKGLTARECAAGVWSDRTIGAAEDKVLYYPIPEVVGAPNGVVIIGEVFSNATVTSGLWYNPNTGACVSCTNLSLSDGYECTTYDITEGATAGTYTKQSFVGSLIKSGTGTPGMITDAESNNAGSGQNKWTLYTAEPVVYDGNGDAAITQLGSLTFRESTGQFTFTHPTNL